MQRNILIIPCNILNYNLKKEGENMLKKLLILICLVNIAIFTTGLVEAQQISSYKILDFSEPYGKENELMTAEKYSHGTQDYYLVTFWTGDDINGEMVFNVNTGEVIQDEIIVKNIIHTSYIISSVDFDTVNHDSEVASYIRESITYFNAEATDWEEYDTNIASTFVLIAEDYSRCLKKLGEIIAIENQIIAGDKSSEISELYMSKTEQYIYETDILSEHFDEAQSQITIYYDAEISEVYYQSDKSELENAKEEYLNYFIDEKQAAKNFKISWTSYEQNIDENTEWELEEMKDRIELTESPGFEIIFSIIGLLTVAFIFRGKIEKN